MGGLQDQQEATGGADQRQSWNQIAYPSEVSWWAAGDPLLEMSPSKPLISTNIKMAGTTLTAIDRPKKHSKNTRNCTVRVCPRSTNSRASLRKPSCSGQVLMLKKGQMFMTSGHTA